MIACTNLFVGNFSSASHLAWIYDIYCKTGVKVCFPIISDRNGTIARKYGMISNDISNTETVRNVFIIDDKGKIRAILVYPMECGRCIPEILRLIEALQTADCNNAATPVNWVPCQPIIVKSPTTFCDLQQRVQDIEENRNGMSWYLSFKNGCKQCDRSIEETESKMLNSENKEQ